jgi:hypothetical protein
MTRLTESALETSPSSYLSIWVICRTSYRQLKQAESAPASGKHSPSLNTLREYAAALGKRLEAYLV